MTGPATDSVTGYLLDENLPRRLTFMPSLPVTHATDLVASGAVGGPTDTQLWEYARTCGRHKCTAWPS